MDRDIETYNAIKQQIETVKGECKEMCAELDHEAEINSITVENRNEKTLNYVAGLQKDLSTSQTPISSDENLAIIQFMNDQKCCLSEIEQLIAYRRSVAVDTKREITRLKTLIKNSLEARVNMNCVQELNPEGLDMAKQQFTLMKSKVHTLIENLFPKASEDMITLLGKLMQEHLDKESDSYIEATSEFYHIVQMFIEMDIVKTHPYDKSRIKLNFV